MHFLPRVFRLSSISLVTGAPPICPRSRGPGTLETATFMMGLCAVRLDCNRNNAGANAGGRYSISRPCSFGPRSSLSSLARDAASDVSRTRSSGSSTCTGSDTGSPLISLPVMRSGDLSVATGTYAMIG